MTTITRTLRIAKIRANIDKLLEKNNNQLAYDYFQELTFILENQLDNSNITRLENKINDTLSGT